MKTLSLERRYLRGEIKKLQCVTKLNASYKNTLNSVTASNTLGENSYKEAWAIIKSVDDLLDGVKRLTLFLLRHPETNQRNSKSGEISSRTNVDEISRKEPSASFSVAESTMEEATPNNDNGDRNPLNDTEDDTTKARHLLPSGDIDTAIDIDDEIELMDDTFLNFLISFLKYRRSSDKVFTFCLDFSNCVSEVRYNGFSSDNFLLRFKRFTASTFTVPSGAWALQ